MTHNFQMISVGFPADELKEKVRKGISAIGEIR